MKRIALFLLLAGITVSTAAQNHNDELIYPKSMTFTTQEQFAELVGSYDTSGNFKFVGKRPAVVDVYWKACRPCFYLAYSLNKWKARYQGQIDFYTLDFDTNQELVRKLTNDAKELPILIFFTRDGKISHLVTGYSPSVKAEKDPIILREINKLQY